jgi:hypothetical protein
MFKMPLIWISPLYSKERWSIFNYLSHRMFTDGPQSLTWDEFRQWTYLRIVFFEEYLTKQKKPWLRGEKFYDSF